MNRNDEQFDEFLRSQFKEQKFELKDQYWKNAQQLIATHRATAGQGMLNAVLSGVVLVVLSAGLLWNSANTPSAANQEQPTAFLATTLPNETTVPLEAALIAPSSALIKPESNTNNNAVSTPTSTEKAFNTNIAKANPKPVKRFVQQQRTRKSALAARGEIAAADNLSALTDEPVIPNTTSDIIYIDGKLYRPLKGASKGIISRASQTDFLPYAASRSKGFLAIEGGLNSYNHSTDLLQSLNFHAGIRYYRFLSPKFAMSTGLTYAQLEQHMDARVVNNVEYSFGQKTNQTKITTLRLDYIEIPLSAYYKIKGNHFVQAGATVGYAIQSSDFIESNGSKGKSDNGYMDGINKMDLQLNVGYTCLIQNKYTLSVGYYQGLMDVSKNASLQTNDVDRNRGIRLTVGYKLF